VEAKAPLECIARHKGYSVTDLMEELAAQADQKIAHRGRNVMVDCVDTAAACCSKQNRWWLPNSKRRFTMIKRIGRELVNRVELIA
jgi:hypothetical protein